MKSEACDLLFTSHLNDLQLLEERSLEAMGIEPVIKPRLVSSTAMHLLYLGSDTFFAKNRVQLICL